MVHEMTKKDTERVLNHLNKAVAIIDKYTDKEYIDICDLLFHPAIPIDDFSGISVLEAVFNNSL